jgi:hypothetical protein
MKRRIVLALLLSVLTLGAPAARALAQTQSAAPNATPQVPPDRISLEDFKALRAAGKIFVLDVRIGATTKIKGATYIPLDQLESRLAELPRDREIITYCS